jgi:hypothetical protein
MRYFKTPDDFDSYADFDAYMNSGEWKISPEHFSSGADWQAYLSEKAELVARLRRDAARQAAEADALQLELESRKRMRIVAAND